LVENAPHVAVALRGPMVVVHAGALVVAGAGAHPGGELLVRTRHLRQAFDRILLLEELQLLQLH